MSRYAPAVSGSDAIKDIYTAWYARSIDGKFRRRQEKEMTNVPFPKERWKEVNAMIANQMPYHSWNARRAAFWERATKAEKLEMTEERSVCEYCAGNTFMDSYGNCRGCGAPKPISLRQQQALIDYAMPSVMSTCAIDYSAPGGIIHWR